MTRWVPGVCAALCIVAGSCDRYRTPASLAAGKVAVDGITPKLLTDLSIIASGMVPEAAAINRALERIRGRKASLADFVDHALHDPGFAHVVAPRLLLASNLRRSKYFQSAVLNSTVANGERTYFLRDPCKPDAALKIHPWWSMNETVRVCPSAYVEGRVRDEHGRWCTGTDLDPVRSSYCGCGPNLLYCARDGKQLDQMRVSALGEVVDTIAYLADHDEPLARVFSSNETIRDAYAEFTYRRERILNGEPLSLLADPWVEPAKPIARHEAFPGQHAGVLTTAHMIGMSTTMRSNLRIFSEMLWDFPQDSVHVTSKEIFALGVTDLRAGDGWQRLAAMPVCNTCHARLDYGMQFFGGYVDSRYAGHFIADRHRAGSGPMYLADIHDPRGETSLTPRGFAEMAVQQPEFAACMTTGVLAHVFNDGSSTEDRRVVLEAFRRSGTLREMMRAALLRYAERQQQAPARAAPPASEQGGRADDGEAPIASHALSAAVEENCVMCHDQDASLNLARERFPRRLAESMLNQVAAGRMPKVNPRIGREARSTLIRTLVDALWSEAADRSRALAYFADGLRAAPVHPISSIMNLVRDRIGVDRVGARDAKTLLDYPEFNNYDDVSQFTPGLGAFVAIEALRLCKERGTHGAALDACLERATAPEQFIIGSPR